MKKVLYFVLGFLTLFNIYFSSYSVMKGEIHFFNDVARDFLLFREIDDKKIMLIGPRSNSSGLYHGPLWSYINYPVYLLGNGNPVTVGWFWVFLGIMALGVGFYLTKKLFGLLPAYAYILLYSSHLVTHTNGMFHSDSPVYLTPLFFFSIFFYEKYKKLRYLVFHFFVLSAIIQLNFGVGTPLLILSSFFVLYLIFKGKLWRHLFSFLVIPLLLSNFVIFDFRHDHLLTKSAYAAYEFTKSWHPLPIGFWISNRIGESVNLHVLQDEKAFLTWIIFGVVLLSTIFEIKTKGKFSKFYFFLTYYYFGYMLLSFLNKGVILGHFVYLLGPLTLLWFISFLRGKYQMLFIPILFLAGVLNFQHGYNFINYLDKSFIEKLPWSWRSTNTVAEGVIKRGEKHFGYFVFSPDAFAYGPRYAMIYHFKRTRLDATEYAKKAVTYVIASPPPDNDPYMTHVWWRKNPVGIKPEPRWTQKYPGGYTVEEFLLSDDEQKIPHDKTIELGIHFR